jgi:nucleoside-diphosphate-sugar epimerase
VIHTSTSEAYGTAQYVPIDEKHPLQGQSPYSASKIAADKVVESYYDSFELPSVTVRPFNTFGPRQSARAFIPTVISQALMSSEIKMGSLDPIRDLTFVKDTAEGLIAIGLCDEAIGKVVNLGTGSGSAVGEVVRTILRLLGREEMPIREEAARVRPAKSEVLRLVSDNRKAKDLAGWSPQVSLEKGLSETIAWVEKNIERYRPEIYNI